MPIKAQFVAEQTEIKVKSLHQWDYGQELEIEATDIPDSIIEVHFACSGMTETVVRSCEMMGGTGIVSIPNRCLEQTNPITAWIYEIEKTDGVVTKCTTTKTITIPIIPRIRPGRSEEIPESDIDYITELIAQINDAMDKIGSGEIIADHAKNANEANHAATAEHANTANKAGHATTAGTASEATRATFATKADSATKADTATNATNDEAGSNITQKYARINYGKQLWNNNSEYRVDPGVLFLYAQMDGDDERGLDAVIGAELAAGTWGFQRGSSDGALAYKVDGYMPNIVPVNRDAIVIGSIGTFNDPSHRKYLIQVSGF